MTFLVYEWKFMPDDGTRLMVRGSPKTIEFMTMKTLFLDLKTVLWQNNPNSTLSTCFF